MQQASPAHAKAASAIAVGAAADVHCGLVIDRRHQKAVTRAACLACGRLRALLDLTACVYGRPRRRQRVAAGNGHHLRGAHTELGRSGRPRSVVFFVGAPRSSGSRGSGRSNSCALGSVHTHAHARRHERRPQGVLAALTREAQPSHGSGHGSAGSLQLVHPGRRRKVWGASIRRCAAAAAAAALGHAAAHAPLGVSLILLRVAVVVALLTEEVCGGQRQRNAALGHGQAPRRDASAGVARRRIDRRHVQQAVQSVACKRLGDGRLGCRAGALGHWRAAHGQVLLLLLLWLLLRRLLQRLWLLGLIQLQRRVQLSARRQRRRLVEAAEEHAHKAVYVCDARRLGDRGPRRAAAWTGRQLAVHVVGWRGRGATARRPALLGREREHLCQHRAQRLLVHHALRQELCAGR
eukprot:364741-Chlamydomonas_euryale.AAC.17